MTTPNGNVHYGPPTTGTVAWDWADLTNDGVAIWRGTPGDPRHRLVMHLDGGYPDEIADWLEALAGVIRRAAEPPTCPQCATPLPPLGIGRPSIYCSDACRQAAYRARHR